MVPPAAAACAGAETASASAAASAIQVARLRPTPTLRGERMRARTHLVHFHASILPADDGCRATPGPEARVSAPSSTRPRVAPALLSTNLMKLTADSLNHHGHGELGIHGYRGASLATIGHRARGGLRAAALLAAATVLLVQPGQAMAQETRAETIRQEQADKLRTVAPPELNGAEKILRRLEDWGWLTGEPRGVYPCSTLSIPAAASPPASARGSRLAMTARSMSSAPIRLTASGGCRRTCRCRPSPRAAAGCR